jgi:YHS domain-containing protein
VAGVIEQPGATLGQRAYCPVSGVIFSVTATTANRTHDQHPLYFCCEACAKRFDENPTKILAARGRN